MSGEEEEVFNERAAGLAMMGAVLFSTVVGLGVGAFVEEPLICGVAGTLFGILLGYWLVPRLMRDWD